MICSQKYQFGQISFVKLPSQLLSKPAGRLQHLVWGYQSKSCIEIFRKGRIAHINLIPVQEMQHGEMHLT